MIVSLVFVNSMVSNRSIGSPVRSGVTVTDKLLMGAVIELARTSARYFSALVAFLFPPSQTLSVFLSIISDYPVACSSRLE